jgi:hypothetical protein
MLYNYPVRTFINPVLGFLDEIDKLSKLPAEILTNEVRITNFGSFDYHNREPLFSGFFEDAYFDSFANSIRKIIILSNEPIALEKVHKSVKLYENIDLKLLEKNKRKIDKYLNLNMSEATQIKLGSGIDFIDNTTVKKLLNDYFAATVQHSKEKPQQLIDSINSLMMGSFLTESIRIMMVDLKGLLEEYSKVVKVAFEKNQKL